MKKKKRKSGDDTDQYLHLSSFFKITLIG